MSSPHRDVNLLFQWNLDTVSKTALRRLSATQDKVAVRMPIWNARMRFMPQMSHWIVGGPSLDIPHHWSAARWFHVGSLHKTKVLRRIAAQRLGLSHESKHFELAFHDAINCEERDVPVAWGFRLPFQELDISVRRWQYYPWSGQSLDSCVWLVLMIYDPGSGRPWWQTPPTEHARPVLISSSWCTMFLSLRFDWVLPEINNFAPPYT